MSKQNTSHPSAADAFDARVDRYDALIDWDKRLAHEAGFYRRQFESVTARRVLDAACGTGRHAAMFHSWGLTVEGADISPGMIDWCRKTYGDKKDLHWVVRSFDTPAEPPGTFDATICIGNSLALAGDQAAVDRSVRAMMQSLRSGGLLILQVLNLWRIPEGKTIWQKHRRLQQAHRDVVLLKGVHRVGDRGYIDLIDLTLTEQQGLEAQFDAPEFIGIDHEWLHATVQQAGGTDVQLYGSVTEEPYDRSASSDLILACRRG